MKLEFHPQPVAALALVVVAALLLAWYQHRQPILVPPATPPTEVAALPDPAERPSPVLEPEPKPTAPVPGTAAPVPATGGSGIRRLGLVSIPRLGVEAPLMVVGKVDEAVFQKALEDGVVLYPGTASPGQPGNSFIFGHSSDYRYRAGSYKTVFARLPELTPGDRVILDDAAARASFTYVVTGSAVVAAGAAEHLSQATGGKQLLTLQTSYPIGTALKRYLVFAELEAAVAKPAP